MSTRYELRYEGNDNKTYTFKCCKELFDKMMIGLEFAPLGEGAHVYFIIHYAKYDHKSNIYWMDVTSTHDDEVADNFLEELLKNEWLIKE